jgi:hypothetical protein
LGDVLLEMILSKSGGGGSNSRCKSLIIRILEFCINGDKLTRSFVDGVLQLD